MSDSMRSGRMRNASGARPSAQGLLWVASSASQRHGPAKVRLLYSRPLILTRHLRGGEANEAIQGQTPCLLVDCFPFRLAMMENGNVRYDQSRSRGRWYYAAFG